MALYEAIGDQLGQANVLRGLTELHLKRGNRTAAKDSLPRLVRAGHASGYNSQKAWRDQIHRWAEELGLIYDEIAGRLYGFDNH